MLNLSMTPVMSTEGVMLQIVLCCINLLSSLLTQLADLQSQATYYWGHLLLTYLSAQQWLQLVAMSSQVSYHFAHLACKLTKAGEPYMPYGWF